MKPLDFIITLIMLAFFVAMTMIVLGFMEQSNIVKIGEFHDVDMSFNSNTNVITSSLTGYNT